MYQSDSLECIAETRNMKPQRVGVLFLSPSLHFTLRFMLECFKIRTTVF